MDEEAPQNWPSPDPMIVVENRRVLRGMNVAILRFRAWSDVFRSVCAALRVLMWRRIYDLFCCSVVVQNHGALLVRDDRMPLI